MWPYFVASTDIAFSLSGPQIISLSGSLHICQCHQTLLNWPSLIWDCWLSQNNTCEEWWHFWWHKLAVYHKVIIAIPRCVLSGKKTSANTVFCCFVDVSGLDWAFYSPSERILRMSHGEHLLGLCQIGDFCLLWWYSAVIAGDMISPLEQSQVHNLIHNRNKILSMEITYGFSKF